MSDPTWWPEARYWIYNNLHARATGPIQRVRERAWSTVAKVPTEDGVRWFKANGPGSRYEAPLLAALGRWAPDQVIVPLAVDPTRGWSLQPDGGTPLREIEGTTLADWERMVGEYAQLQRALLPRTQELLELGVPELSPTVLTSELDRLLGLHELPEVAAFRPRFAELCAELADSAIAPGLQHDDLHDANVLLGPDGRYRIFDWGDASITHPFGTMRVTLRVAAKRFGLSLDDPAILRVRDAYLEVWSDLAPRPELARTMEVAIKLGALARALCWERSLIGATEAELAEWADAVPGWLGELVSGPDLAARR